ncbi:DUF6979 family protein, partial [Escherichia coli]|uniref:DUF6979 family protein n=1 Tax=Escherichia coli TaxID=562 RepID=UPI003EE39E1E
MLVKYFQENSVSLPIFDTDAGIIIPVAGVAHDDTERESSRKKICPRATFLALADSGYLKNVKPLHGEKKGGKLYQRAI